VVKDAGGGKVAGGGMAWRTMLALFALGMCAADAKATGFRGLNDPIKGFCYTSANAVSPDGMVVVGHMQPCVGPLGNPEAFRWTASGGLVGLGDLPGGLPRSQARGVSLNGAVIVGASDAGAMPYPDVAFRWTDDFGIHSIGQTGGEPVYSQASAVSADGSLVVGRGTTANGIEALVWPSAGGTIPLGFLPETYESLASAVSADGSVVVGHSSGPNVAHCVRWTAANGMQALGNLGGGKDFCSARGISADGTVIVGWSASGPGRQAFRWDKDSGMVPLGELPGGAFFSYANAVSADGRVVVGLSETGTSPSEAFIWTRDLGIRNLKTLLVDNYGLDLEGWILTEANGITSDGMTIVGSGINPAGQQEGWIVTLPPPRGPRVESVSVGGLTWAGNAYTIPDGSPAQLLPMPWNRLNQVSVVFDQSVSIELDDVRLIDNDGTEYELFGPILSTGPELGTVRALFMLENPLDLGDYELRLLDTIRDNELDRLDGEWIDGVSSQSGDGAVGGDFVYHFRVLLGDTNQDGAVNVLDWAEVRDRQGSRPGDAAYLIFHDIDRRGSVDLVDFDLVPRRAFTGLPPWPMVGAPQSIVVSEPAASALAVATLVAILTVYAARRRAASLRERRR
jgi:probable HAF family extracellular repeat protein